ncbi:MAG TPA: DUF4412 domain-containing protein [Polyangiaceae bacterium]|jgi:hypothetical protein
MRRFVIVVALATLASCKLKGFGASDGGGAPSIVSTLASLVAFEGEIDMTMTMALAPATGMTTSFEMRGTKVRTETKGLATSVSITDMGAKKSWMIDNTARTYTEIDLAKLGSSSSSAVKSTAKARSLGKADKVAGYSCDLWEVVDATMRAEMCMASGLSMMALGLSGPFSMLFTKDDDAWSQVLSHGFPLRLVITDPSGAPMMKMEATRVEKRSIPDSEFAIPAGYTKMPSPI